MPTAPESREHGIARRLESIATLAASDMPLLRRAQLVAEIAADMQRELYEHAVLKDAGK